MKLKFFNRQRGFRSRTSARSARSCHSSLVTRHRFAFTLIEVMIAITIFSLVLTAIYSTWTLIWRASRVSQTAAAQVQRQRVAIHTIEDALTCIQSFEADMQYYSFIVSADPPLLEFTSRLPDNFPRNGKFGDLNVRQLVFSVEPPPNAATDFSGNNSEKDLVLRQKPILLDMDEDEQKNPLVLARDVQTFKVECWDTNQVEWVTEWDNTNSIPPLIRVSLVLGGSRDNLGNPAPTLSVTRVIAVPSQTLPAIVQAGIAGPGGGAAGVNFVSPTAPGGNGNNPNNLIRH